MILCDTNVIIEALKNNPVVIAAMEKIGLERIAVSVVTVKNAKMQDLTPK